MVAVLACCLPLVASALQPSAFAARGEEGLHIVRFAGPISPADRVSLDDTGVTVVDYEHPRSYIVWADPEAMEAVAALSRVRTAEPLGHDRKLHPSLTQSNDAAAYVEVTVFGPLLPAALDHVAKLGDVRRAYQARADGLGATIGAYLPRAALTTVVEHPAVLYVNPASPRAILEDEMGTQIVAGNVDEDARPVPGYREWLERRGLSGEGVTVAIVDTGMQENHPDFGDRVERKIDYSRVAEPIDTLGHGTHVAGIVGGDPPFDLSDRNGFVYGIGVAPAVRFVDQNAIGVTATFPPPEGFAQLSADAWEAGARMWNASWHTGEGSRSGYTASTREMDEISRNAVFENRRRQEFLLVFSAGNAGASGPTVPKEAKNIISVGATNSGRGVLWPLTSDPENVASFSSRGPTLDERFFPVVSAPGANVMSARAPEGALTAAACVAPPDGALLYASCSGTSMAAPHVAGSAALIHEWYRDRRGGRPSPAMVKALLVNSATDIGDIPIPNNDEGWGRIDLGRLFSRTPMRLSDQQHVFTGRGQSRLR
jgi:subtilisin family serine protease